jgi:beta-glucosidase-like glycosyl hydrolase
VPLRTPRATLLRRAAAYRACADGGLVMVNSARYAALGPGPALLRRETYRLLRDLDVTAPTITDSLQAQALAGLRHVPLRAVQAGVDLLLTTGSQATAADIYLGLAGASRRGELGAARVMAGAERIARLMRYLR